MNLKKCENNESLMKMWKQRIINEPPTIDNQPIIIDE